MPNIKHLVKIDATAESIYEAITTVRGLSNWWTPSTEGSEKKGEELLFHFGPDYYKVIKTEKLEPHRYVEWTCLKAVDEWVGTTISFEIRKEKDGCTLIFNHDNWKDYTDMYSQCNYHWALFLRSLHRYVEIGEGIPYPDQAKITVNQ